MATDQAKRTRREAKPLVCPHCNKGIDVVGTKDVVGILGVSPSTFQNFRERPNFPEPLAVVGQGALWLRADIEKWHHDHQEQRVEALLGDLDKRLDHLDPEMRKAVMQRLKRR